MRKVFGVIMGCFLTLLACGYVTGCWYFQSHFYYGTVIDGIACGCLTEVQTCEQLIYSMQDDTLTVCGKYWLEDSMKVTDAGMILEPEKEVHKILNGQRFWLWPLSFFETHVYRLEDSFTLDEEQFREEVLKLSVFSEKYMQEPMDARLSEYSSSRKGYYVVPEVDGNLICREEALDAVRQALLNREDRVELTGDQYYVLPSRRSDDEMLQQKAAQLNELTGLEFVYDMHGIEVRIDGDQIHEWLVITDDILQIDEEKVRAYVQTLADTYDTYGKERNFVTVDGVRKTLRSGAYGWKLDIEPEQEALLAMLKERRSGSRTPEWKKRGYAEGESDIGNTYVEIDLTNQHLYLIREGSVVMDSPIVSGNVSRGCSTPSGVFGVTYKTRNAVLRGADYATPVSYWMPFNRNIGMHDAAWRGSFGGTIYKTNGSHGCINLPYDKAKKVYQFVEKNMPVVCYY